MNNELWMAAVEDGSTRALLEAAGRALVHGGRLRSLRPIKAATVVSEEDRTIDFVITTGTRDRMGDTINPKGWELANYRKNPVIQWAHDYDHPPIGRSLSVKRSTEHDGLVSRAQFAPTETKGSFLGGVDTFNLYKEGYLHAVSVGFLPTKKPVAVYEEDVEPSWETFIGFDFPGNELLEYSAVPVPANPEALALGFKSGKIAADVVMAIHGIGPEILRPGENCKACEARDQRDARERAAVLLDGLVERFREQGRIESVAQLSRRLSHARDGNAAQGTPGRD